MAHKKPTSSRATPTAATPGGTMGGAVIERVQAVLGLPRMRDDRVLAGRAGVDARAGARAGGRRWVQAA